MESTENARVAQLKRDASTIAQQADTTLVHNLEDVKCINFLSQVCYVYDVPGVSHTMIQDDQYGSMVCNVAMLWCLLTSSLLSFPFCLKAYSFFLIWPQCTNQDSNSVYAGTNL